METSRYCEVQFERICEIKPTGCGSPSISQYIEYNILLLCYIGFFLLSLRHTIRRLGASRLSLLHSRLGTALFISIILLSACEPLFTLSPHCPRP